MGSSPKSDTAPDLFYLPPPDTEAPPALPQQPPPFYTDQYQEYGKRSGSRNTTGFFKGYPLFLVPIAGMGATVYALLASLVKLKAKSLESNEAKKRILEKQFMFNMTLRVRMQVFTLATGVGCLMYYDYKRKQHQTAEGIPENQETFEQRRADQRRAKELLDSFKSASQKTAPDTGEKGQS